MIESIVATNVEGYSALLNQFDNKLPVRELVTSVESRHEQRERVQEHGMWPTFTYLGIRKWTINGDILADTPDEFGNLRGTLKRAFMPYPRRGFRYVVQLQVKFVGHPPEIVWSECDIDGVPEIPLNAGLGPSRAPFSIGLTQADPRMYGVTQQSVTLAPLGAGAGGVVWNGGAGVSWNSGAGVTWGNTAQAGQLVTVTSIGDIDTPPLWRIYGPCANPQLRWLNEDGENESVVMSGLVIDASDYVDVDFRLRKAENSSGGSVYYTIDPSRSSWWTLMPGDNQVSFFVDDSAAPCRAVLTWYNAYMP